MEYAEKGSLADALRTGRLKRPGGFPELGVIIACLQDIASGELADSSPWQPVRDASQASRAASAAMWSSQTGGSMQLGTQHACWPFVEGIC